MPNGLLTFDTDTTPAQPAVTGTDDGLTRTTMNLIFLLDTSGSMNGERIEQLNNAMPIAFDAASEAALNKESEVRFRVIAFNSTAKWVIGDADHGASYEEAKAQWKPLSAGGGTATSDAIELCLTCLHTKQMGTRGYTPVVILITDGGSNVPSDTQAASDKLARAMTGNNPNKKNKVWRFAIGVKDYIQSELEYFAMRGNLEDEYGNTTEDVPMVFPVINVNTLTKVLKGVTVGSLLSSTMGNAANGTEGPTPIIDI